MPRNGSGTYSPPTGQPVITGTTVSSTVFNALVADVGTEITRSLATDGQTPMAAALPMGNNKITNLAYGVLASDAARLDQAGASGALTLPSGTTTTVGAKLIEDVKTGDYSTLAAALTAAANRRLIVNSAVAVTSNTTIPATVETHVLLGASFAVSAGITLTIAGAFTAGEYVIFTGAGSVVFTVSSRAKDLAVWRGGSLSAVFSQARTLLQSPTDVGGPVHAFEDNNTLNFTNPKAANYNAYAAFDANTTATGAGSYDHMVGFQSRQTYNGSNEIWARFDGFNFLGTHSGTGRVAIMRGLHVENPLGSGQIDFLAGVLVEQLDRGTQSYGFYSATSQNVVSTGPGMVANWLLRGNGQTGGFGMLVQSAADSSAKVWNTANAALSFGANNAENMRLTPAGLLKIGAPATILTDNSQVEVQGYGGITLKATGGAGAACSLNWNSDTAGNSLFSVFYTETGATQRGSIDYNRAGGLTRYNTTSDGTLKNVLGDSDVQKSLDILASTRLRNYTWKDDPTGKLQIGPIAQELYQTYPGAVSVGGEYEETIAAVTEQRVIKEAAGDQPAEYETVVITPERVETRYRPWGVDKTAFTFHLVAGHQYHTKQIADLQAMVADLSARVAKLESSST
jgi:hypothetical protein